MASVVGDIQTKADWQLGATRLFGNFDLASEGLIRGWSAPEDSHVWNDGPEAVLQIVIQPVKRALRISVEGTPFIGGRSRFQDVALYVNGARVGFWRLREQNSYVLSAVIEPEQMLERGGRSVLNCVWHLPGSARPIDVGVGSDTREIGLCFRSVTLS